MNKEWREYIALRCQEALVTNEDYIVKERCSEYNEKLSEISLQLCYERGVIDAKELLNYIEKNKEEENEDENNWELIQIRKEKKSYINGFINNLNNGNFHLK